MGCCVLAEIHIGMLEAFEAKLGEESVCTWLGGHHKWDTISPCRFNCLLHYHGPQALTPHRLVDD